VRVLVACLLVACGRVDFDVVDEIAPLTVTKLELYDHTTNQPIADVTNGAPFDISAYPSGVALVATVAGTPGSVEFLRGTARSVENSAPFASGSDNNNSDVDRDDMLVVGKTPIKVTAFELAETGGMKGPTTAITLELTLRLDAPPAIARVGIIDDGNSSFLEVKDGAIVSIANANLPARADMRVDTTPGFGGSVEIGGVGPWSSRGMDNFPTYTAMGEGLAFAPTPGNYTITARAFTLGNGLGEGGATTSVTFQIVP